ncbi:hypothetical protein ACFLX3_01960 [Chloroflexota bacterium]
MDIEKVVRCSSPSQFEVAFVSLAHSEKDIVFTVAAALKSLE